MEELERLPNGAKTLNERKFEYDVATKQRELDLREREVVAKETEQAFKNRELERSRWLNPTVIGIFVAAIGLISSVVVARLNNKATQDLERQRAQSTIILEAIRTGTGNTDASCKNLIFLTNLGLIDDPLNTIHKQCASVPSGIPSLPATVQTTDDSGERVKAANALRTLKNLQSSLKFQADLSGQCRKTEVGHYSCYEGDKAALTVTNNGPVNLFVAIVDVDPSLSVIAITGIPKLVRPNQTIRFNDVVFMRPYGTDTLKVFAAKEPFDVNLFTSSPRGIKSLPESGDWGVVDLFVDTQVKPAGSVGRNSKN